MIENYTMGPNSTRLFIYLYYMCSVITIMIEDYTMGPNSTSLFILTLRKSYKLSDSRVILPCCGLQF